MKKAISLILALVMLCSLLAACGNGSTGEQPAPSAGAENKPTEKAADSGSVLHGARGGGL